MAPVTVVLPQLNFVTQSNTVLDVETYINPDFLGAYTNVNIEISVDVLNNMFTYVGSKDSLGSIEGIGSLGFCFTPPPSSLVPTIKKNFTNALTSFAESIVNGGYDATSTIGAQYNSPYVAPLATATFAEAYAQFTAVYRLSGSADGSSIGTGTNVNSITTTILGVSNLGQFKDNLENVIDNALAAKLNTKLAIIPGLYDNTETGAASNANVSLEVMRALFVSGRTLSGTSDDLGTTVTYSDGSDTINIEDWLTETTLLNQNPADYTRYAGKLEAGDTISFMLILQANPSQLVPAVGGLTGTISDRTYRINFKAVA
jgi:hypothetical protein